MRTRITLVAAALLTISAVAQAQLQLKVSDTLHVKFGLLLQSHADATQDSLSGDYAQNVFVRRARFMVGGQLSKNLTFFAETDSPNLGRLMANGSKNIQPTTYIQDAYVEYRVNDALSVSTGLLLVSPARNGLQSAASLLLLDYGPYTFANSSPTQSSAGRDTGVAARGYLLDRKLEYRAGVYQGMRDTPDRELRTSARVQYNFLEPETSVFYTGTHLGKKKILAIGAGVDRQHSYLGYAADAFLDLPVPGGAVTAQAGHIRYDGKDFLRSLSDQHDTLVEAGFLIGGTRLQPVVQYARREIPGTAAGDEERRTVGLNYFLSGHNANLKMTWTQIRGRGQRPAKQFTAQFQVFYF